MNTITIEGQLRTEFGKAATRQLRSEEKVPGVIYGGAKEINFTAPASAFKSIVYTPDFMLTEIKIDGSAYRCVLKEMQFDKVSDLLLHVDFLELVEDKKVVVTIPLKFSGIPAGVKAGGKLATKMKALKVKTLPKYLRENIENSVLEQLMVCDTIPVKQSTTKIKVVSVAELFAVAIRNAYENKSINSLFLRSRMLNKK